MISLYTSELRNVEKEHSWLFIVQKILNKSYITIDIKDEVLVLAKRNLEAAYEKKGQEIDNVALMSQEIAIIDNMLGDGDEISRIYINFCNPWPEDRHKKRRLLSSSDKLKNIKNF